MISSQVPQPSSRKWVGGPMSKTKMGINLFKFLHVSDACRWGSVIHIFNFSIGAPQVQIGHPCIAVG